MQIKTTDGAIQIDGNEFIPKGTFKAWVDDLDRLNITALIVSNALIVPTLFSSVEIDGESYSDLELFKTKIGQSFFKSAAGGGGLTPEEKAKVDSLRTNGDGTKYLADDGVYKNIGFTDMQFSNSLKFDKNYKIEGEISSLVNFSVDNSVTNLTGSQVLIKLTGGSIIFSDKFIELPNSNAYDGLSNNVIALRYDFGVVSYCIYNYPLDLPIDIDINSLWLVPEDIQTFDKVIEWNGNNYSDFVHPYVQFFPNGWNGHNYWMGITPYAATQNSTENPMLFYSDEPNVDGWKTLAGAPQPIYGIKAGTQHNSDSCIHLDEDGITLHYLNRYATSSGGGIEHFSSIDGITWTPRVTIIGTELGQQDIVSPSLCRYNNKWYIFGTPTNAVNTLDVYEFTTFEASSTTKVNSISLSPLGDLWHCEVRYFDEKFYLLGSTGGTGGGNLRMAKFNTPMDSGLSEIRNCAIFPIQQSSMPELNAYYKSSFIIKNDGSVEFFNGMKSPLLNSNTKWRVRSEKVKELVDDWSILVQDLEEVYSYSADLPVVGNDGWTTYNNIIQRNDNVWVNHCGIEATVKSIPFQITMGRVNTGGVQSVIGRIDANSVIRFGNVEYANNVDTAVNISVKVGDKVAIFSDETTVYYFVRGAMVHSQLRSESVKTFNGVFYGGQGGTIGDIKVYQLPEFVMNANYTTDILASRMADALVNPSDYYISDNFNRAILGTTDDLGHTYKQLLNVATINSNSLRGTNINGFAIFSDITTSFEYVADMLSTVGVFDHQFVFNFTDSSNYQAIKFRLAGSLEIRLVNVVSGVETVLSTKYSPRVPTLINSIRLNYDIVSNSSTVFYNNIKVATFDMTAPIVDFGIRLSITNLHVNNINIKKV